MKYADIQIKRLGLADYLSTWRAMQDFTLQRDAASADELWLTQHEPVYTLGLAGKSEHLLEENGIPLVKVDRGGQITYHGPGQLVLYLLLDLKRRGLGVRELVGQMEHAVMDLLGRYGVTARLRPGAPGVYVDGAKVAALGLRVRRGCCYHGIAFNVDMDLAPFQAINPCGYPGLRVTQARDLGIRDNIYTLGDELAGHLQARLHATRIGH